MDFDTAKVTHQFVTAFNANLNDFINHQIFQNDFFIAGIFTVLTSALLYVMRNLPGKIWHALYHRCTMTIVINNDNKFFVDIAEELSKNAYQFFSRAKILDERRVTIGFARSFTKFNGYFVICHRSKEEGQADRFKQSVTLTFPFISNDKMVSLFNEFTNRIENKNSSMIELSELYGNRYLQRIGFFPKRKRDSIFINQKTLDHIHSKIEFFVQNREWYEIRGIPYKYALLLHGVPGTGKTSLAKYIVSYLNRQMIITNPTELSGLAKAISSKIIDDEFEGIDSSRYKYVCLVEDIDTYDATRSREENDEPTSVVVNTGMTSPDKSLSAILNSIDGLNSPQDIILIATTNHLEKLDPALIRKGRFDDVIELLPLENDEIHSMINKFIDDKKFLKSIENIHFEPIIGSNLQDLLMENLDKPENILNTLVQAEVQNGKN